MPLRNDRSNRSLALLAAYGAILALTVAAFLVIRWFGEGLQAPAASAAAGAVGGVSTASRSEALMHLLLALASVIALGRLLGWAFAYIRQPPVIGEVLAGILLGPSFLGRVAPEIGGYLLPQSVAPTLSVVAQLGVILYMFVVGLEFDANLLRARGHATIAISHASIVLPFILGSTLALALYSTLAPSHVSFTSFALFLGVSMSVTAFPVLARILTDRRMHKTDLGVMALACAATDDVTAWCLLAFVVGVAQAKVEGALLVALLTVAYIAAMFVVVRPLLAKLHARYDHRVVSQRAMAVVFVGLLCSALLTELIGIHAIFGAFLLGAIIPHDSTIARELSHKLEDLVTVLLLPAFFAFTGMRTQIGLVDGWLQWLVCGVVILVATAGKFGGTLAAARMTGMPWRDSAALGVLMNTRGLMELIVLNVGLDLGVISPTLFAMMVIMALVTTMATSPLLSWLVPSTRVAVDAPPRELESTVAR